MVTRSPDDSKGLFGAAASTQSFISIPSDIPLRASWFSEVFRSIMCSVYSAIHHSALRKSTLT